MQNIARELHKSVKNKERGVNLHKSVKNKERGVNLHKSVIGNLWKRRIFAI